MTIEEYASVRATPGLVGRQDILQDIYNAIKEKSDTPHVFYITAPGGWGKTRLLDAVLKKMTTGEEEWGSSNILSASRLVDLYHTYTHSDEGLVTDIVEVLDRQGKYFNNYVQQHAELDRVKYDLSQILQAVTQQRERMMEAFINDFNNLGNNCEKIVLAFDTVENLVYETDRVQDALGLADEPIGVAGWLVESFLPKIHNTVILIAGRPESPQLQIELEKLKQNHGIKFSNINLGTFSETETLAYFNAVLEVARDENPQIADRLERIPQETRQVVHYLSEGQPFLLSLFVDYLVVADELLPVIHTPLDEIKKRAISEKGLRIEREEFRDAILQEFQKIRRPFDEVIRALSWTQKGMGSELLAWIMKRDRPTENEIEQAKGYIQTLRDPNFRLSFVKIRDIDNLVFLQDEMYSLMRSLHHRGRLRHNVKQTYELIVQFYEEKIKEQANIVRELQKITIKLVSSGSLKEFTESQNAKLVIEQQNLRTARGRLQSYQVEHVYYSLQANSTKGIQAYSRTAEEAFQSNDTNLWLLLRDELLKFAKPLRSRESEIEALRYIDGDIGVRWIKNSLANGNYERARFQIEKFRETCPDLLVEGSFANLNLRVWESWLLASSGIEFKRAESILQSILVSPQNFSEKFDPEFDEWRRMLLIAYAQDVLAHLYRSQGNFTKAVEYYRKNLRFWRSLYAESEQANTLNNLSWSLAEIGEFETAINYCEDGLDLRRKLGYRYPIALSLTTLGLIETRYGQPERARFRCEQALGIFRDLEQPRGIRYASHELAESLRMMADVSDLLTDEQSMKNLELAEQYSKESIGIFTDIVKEPMRLAEAYIELGCIYREMARRMKSKNAVGEDFITKGKEAFDAAVRIAGTEFAYRGVDALVNLAWMYYYVGDFEKAQKGVDSIIIDDQYLFTKTHAPLVRDDLVPWYWVQLGKANLLLGKMAFDRYEEANARNDFGAVELQLEKVAHYWMLSIAYYLVYGKAFRDFVLGRKLISNCLRTFNSQEIEWVRHGIHKAYKMYFDAHELMSFETFIAEQF